MLEFIVLVIILVVAYKIIKHFITTQPPETDNSIPDKPVMDKATRILMLISNGARCENCTNHSSSCYGLPNPCSLYTGPHNV